MLNALGSAVYAMTAVFCLRAWLVARPPGERRFWFAATLFFSALIAARLLGIEDLLRERLRGELVSEGIYARRREFQAGLAVLVILAVAALMVPVIRLRRPGQPRRTHRSLRWAMLGLCLMAGLILLRVISFHTTDALLYAGPIRLNWILDIGASGLTGGASAWYARVVRPARAGPASRPGRP